MSRIFKDRYTYAFGWALIMLFLSMWVLRKGSANLASLLFVLSTLFIAYVMIRRPRIHYDELPEGIQFKPEKGSGFVSTNSIEIDGILINRRRYKMVSGTDIYIDQLGNLTPCGPGSYLMQQFGNGGFEPKSIQNDPHWRINSGNT